jgi:hypothetical protein
MGIFNFGLFYSFSYGFYGEKVVLIQNKAWGIIGTKQNSLK